VLGGLGHRSGQLPCCAGEEGSRLPGGGSRAQHGLLCRSRQPRLRALAGCVTPQMCPPLELREWGIDQACANSPWPPLCRRGWASTRPVPTANSPYPNPNPLCAAGVEHRPDLRQHGAHVQAGAVPAGRGRRRAHAGDGGGGCCLGTGHRSGRCPAPAAVRMQEMEEVDTASGPLLAWDPLGGSGCTGWMPWTALGSSGWSPWVALVALVGRPEWPWLHWLVTLLGGPGGSGCPGANHPLVGCSGAMLDPGRVFSPKSPLPSVPRPESAADPAQLSGGGEGRPARGLAVLPAHTPSPHRCCCCCFCACIGLWLRPLRQPADGPRGDAGGPGARGDGAGDAGHDARASLPLLRGLSLVDCSSRTGRFMMKGASRTCSNLLHVLKCASFIADRQRAHTGKHSPLDCSASSFQNSVQLVLPHAHTAAQQTWRMHSFRCTHILKHSSLTCANTGKPRV